MRLAVSIVFGIACATIVLLTLARWWPIDSVNPSQAQTGSEAATQSKSATTPRALIAWAEDHLGIELKPQMVTVMRVAIDLLGDRADRSFAEPSSGSEGLGPAWSAVIKHVTIGLEHPRFNRDYAYFLAWCLHTAQMPSTASWQVRSDRFHAIFERELLRLVQPSLSSIPSDKADILISASAAVAAISSEIRERIRANCRNPFLPIWHDDLPKVSEDDLRKRCDAFDFPVWGSPPDTPVPGHSALVDDAFLRIFKGKIGLYGHAVYSGLFVTSIAAASKYTKRTPWGQMSYRMVNAHRHYWPAWVGFVPIEEALNRKWIP